MRRIKNSDTNEAVQERGSPMPLAPWSLFKTWSCLKCGLCCRKYTVPLNKGEAEFYQAIFGDDAVAKVNGKFVLRKIGNRCIFQNGSLCAIQELKPRNCKLWPFIVMKKPLNKRTAKLAEYEFQNEVFYVYVDTFCKGINAGYRPIEEAVREAITDFLEYSPIRGIVKKFEVEHVLIPPKGYLISGSTSKVNV